VRSGLFVLERCVHIVEWFDRETLHAVFEADRANGEEVYDVNLQRFLFQEGGHGTHVCLVPVPCQNLVARSVSR